MVDPDFLYTVAQVGVTYAGFSTLVTVVAYRRNMGAVPARIYYMLLLSIILISFALVPVVIQTYNVNENLAWKVSSGLFAVAWGAYWINAIVKLRTRFKVWDTLSTTNKVNTAVIHPASVICLLLGTFGVWEKYTSAVYVTALFIMLYMSAFLFLQIITGLLDDQTGS